MGAFALCFFRVENHNLGHVLERLENVSVPICKSTCGGENYGFETCLANNLDFGADGGDECRADVVEVGDCDEELGNSLVSVDLALGYCRDEFVILVQDEVGEFLNVRGNGGREEHTLTLCGVLVWETGNDILKSCHETHIKKSISFIQNKGIEVAEGVANAFIAEVIVKTARGSNQNVASVSREN